MCEAYMWHYVRDVLGEYASDHYCWRMQPIGSDAQLDIAGAVWAERF